MSLENTPSISVLLPVYNEEGNVALVYSSAAAVLNSLPAITFEIIFIDDGSSDQTLNEVKGFAEKNTNIRFISFSRNFGKDHALMAGLRYCRGNAAIMLDADMQHPPGLIADMIKYWQEGFEVVYACREEKNRHAGTVNQLASRFFYSLINRLSDVKLENGISDYRLLDRKVVNALIQLKEDNPFLRGLVKWVGFKQKALAYTPAERTHGVTKYRFSSLLRLGLHGITSFSTKPLTYAIYIGFFVSLASILYIPYVLYSLFIHAAISGWASTIVTIAFFGGLQLMILGIIGLYLGKVFMQAKERPAFIIRESNFL